MNTEEMKELEARAKAGDGVAERALFRARLADKLAINVTDGKDKNGRLPGDIGYEGRGRVEDITDITEAE